MLGISRTKKNKPMKNWKLKFWSKINAIAMHYIMKSKPNKKEPTQEEQDKEMKPGMNIHDILKDLGPHTMFAGGQKINGKGKFKTDVKIPKEKKKDKYSFHDIKPDKVNHINNLWLEDDEYYKTAAYKWLNEYIKDEKELYLNLMLLMALNDVQGTFEFKKGYRYIKTIENTVIKTKAGEVDGVFINIDVVCDYKEVTQITFKQEKFYFRKHLLVDEMTEAILHVMKNAKHKYTFVEWNGLKKYLKRSQKTTQRT